MNISDEAGGLGRTELEAGKVGNAGHGLVDRHHVAEADMEPGQRPQPPAGNQRLAQGFRHRTIDDSFDMGPIVEHEWQVHHGKLRHQIGQIRRIAETHLQGAELDLLEQFPLAAELGRRIVAHRDRAIAHGFDGALKLQNGIAQHRADGVVVAEIDHDRISSARHIRHCEHAGSSTRTQLQGLAAGHGNRHGRTPPLNPSEAPPFLPTVPLR
ncbi:hypothetical protein N8D56_07565 [Devosia sp. A8/3-2]|nr:hypothetical protein N8D56_07565 [Devosia sp. A8/3-2]